MANGKFAAYRNIRPLQGDVTNDLLNAEDQQFKHRAEKREIEDRNQLKQDRAAAKASAEFDKKAKSGKELEAELKNATISETGHESHDEKLIKLLTGEGGIYDQVSKLHDELEKDPYNPKLLVKKINLENHVNELKALREGVMAREEDNKKGINDGIYSKSLNKDWRDSYDKTIGEFNFDYKITEDGRIVIVNKSYDPDKDGLPNEFTLDDVWDPEKLGGNKKYFDTNGWLKASKEKYGTLDEKTDEKGFITREIKGFNPQNRDALRKDIDSMFGADKKDMTDAAKSFINDTLEGDFNNIDEKKFDIIKEEFQRQFIATYDKKDYKTKNYSAENAAATQARLNKKDDKTETASKKSVFNVMKSTDGKPIITQSANGRTFGFTTEPTEAKIGNKTLTIKKLYLADDGTVTYDGTEKIAAREINKQAGGEVVKVKEPAKIKSVNGGAINEEDLNEAAISLNYTDAFELKQALESAKTGKTQTKQSVKNSISRSNIEAAAKNSGRSIKEYTKLLTEKGIEITD